VQSDHGMCRDTRDNVFQVAPRLNALKGPQRLAPPAGRI
jgi:hypothetical protein